MGPPPTVVGVGVGYRRELVTDERKYRMTSTVMAEVDIDVPISRVYDHWLQIKQFPEIMQAVESIVVLDGLRSRWVICIGGVERDVDAVMIDRRDEHYVAWSATDHTHRGRVEFEPIEDDGTRLSVSISWEPGGFLDKSGTALHVDSHHVDAELARFKSYVEDAEHQKHRTALEWDAPNFA